MPPSFRRHHLDWLIFRVERAQGFSSRCSPRTLARQIMLTRYGWGRDQFRALDAIIRPESGWVPCRHFPSTTNCRYGPFPSGGGSACGIPQAVPCSKLIGRTRELGQVSVREQIGWLLRYIRGRYVSPSRALAFRRSHGYY